MAPLSTASGGEPSKSSILPTIKIATGLPHLSFSHTHYHTPSWIELFPQSEYGKPSTSRMFGQNSLVEPLSPTTNCSSQKVHGMSMDGGVGTPICTSLIWNKIPHTLPTIRFLERTLIVPSAGKEDATKEIQVTELMEILDEQPYAMKNGNQVHLGLPSKPLGALPPQKVCLGDHLSVGGYILEREGGTQTSSEPEGETTSGGE